MTNAFVLADERLGLREWTVCDLLGDAARKAPDAIALKQHAAEWREAGSWSYASLQVDAQRLGQFLQSHFKQGENVAIWAANSAQWTLYQFAAAAAGLVLVTLNPALREREIEALLRQSRAAGIIADPEYRGVRLAEIATKLQAELPYLRIVLRTDAWRAHLAAAPPDAEPIVVRPGDPAMLLYTSGTTGKPKGVVLLHRGIVNNAIAGSERYELKDGVAWLGVLPLFHVGGSVTSTLGCVARLGKNVVVGGFDAAVVLKLLEDEKIAWFPVVPPMVISMLEHEAFATTDLSNLQLILTGGTTITPDFVRLVREKFHVDVQVMFGQTEAGGGMTKTYRTDSAEMIAATVGRPYAHTAMRIADTQTGATLAAGEIGEIRIRSPFMTDQYFENPEATAAVFDETGFLRTGDLGTLDEQGYLRITGRLKEMIIRGGENIYPREIEDTLGEYPGIMEAAVVSVPHERWGEEVVAAIRCNAGLNVDINDVRDFLLARLARHKVPKLMKIVEDFPRSASGKIQKFEVTKLFAPD